MIEPFYVKTHRNVVIGFGWQYNKFLSTVVMKEKLIAAVVELVSGTALVVGTR